MICLAVTYLIKAGHEDEVVEHLASLTDLTRQESGCKFYQTHRSTTDPRKFFLYEQYVDQASLDFHRATPYFEIHVKNGLIALAESRSPELYMPLGD